MANDKTIVDDSSMDMGYEPYEPPKQKRSPMGVFKNALERITNPFNVQYGEDEREVDLKEAMSPKQYADYLEEQKRAWEPDPKEETLDVPEIETQVVDLPEEDENEKELVVEHTDENEPTSETSIPQEEPTEEPLTEQEIDTNQDTLDATMVDDVLGNTNEPKEESGDKTLTPMEKEDEDMNEMRALAQDDLEGFKYDSHMDKWTPKQKQDAIKSYLEKKKAEQAEEEPVEEEPPKAEEPPKVMTDEEALEEARMLAQDDLEGFNIKGSDWSKLTTKEKGEVIDRFLNKDKSEDNITNVDEDTTNNYSSYERYPTGLRVAEDALQGASNVIDRAERASKENLAGGTSINNMVNKNAIPHYDYRRFFGQ